MDKEIGWEGVEYIDLTVGVDKWRALVNTLMKLKVP